MFDSRSEQETSGYQAGAGVGVQCPVKLETKVHMKVRNHGEGLY